MEANITCPKCRKSFSVRFDEIGPGKARSCANCSTIITFSGQDLGKVKQAIQQLTHQVGNGSVTINVKTSVRRPWWKFLSR